MYQLTKRREMDELTLDTILKYACPARELDDGFNEYYIDTHCVRFTIEARSTRGSDKYEIRSAKMRSI